MTRPRPPRASLSLGNSEPPTSPALSSPPQAAREPGLWCSALVESCGEAIIGEDLDGTIVSWNPAAERIFGFAEREIVGRPAGTLVPPEMIDEARQLSLRVTRQAAIEPYETRRRRADGRDLQVVLTQSPVIDEHG